MTWMLTSTGAEIDLRFMPFDRISILDIAHHLAQINRFCGACVRPYSVAEHSLFVCEILEHDGETDPSLLLAALLHDAHEAYTQDLCSPMKQIIGEAWNKVERDVQHAVLSRFGVLYDHLVAAEQIKWADLTALVTERQQLLPVGGPYWPVEKTHLPVNWWNFEQRAKFAWTDWRQAFLDKFEQLHFLRSERARQHAA